jgi:hypothetical protein
MLPVVDGVVFKLLEDFPRYAVGDDASVWSKTRGDWKKLKPWPFSAGYMQIGLYNADGMKRFSIHVLVCTAFHGPCPLGKECCHEDGNPANNKPSNLRWGTKLENHADRERHDTIPYGERMPTAVLDDETVREIRRRYIPQCKQNGAAAIARGLGCGASTVKRAIRGLTWRRVK